MEKKSFEKELAVLLNDLKPEMKPLWGIMSPQHMIEHLIVTWKVSRGRIQLELIDNKNLDKKREFLMSDRPYEHNIPIPALQGKLQPLRFPDLETAKAALLDEIRLFHEYYDSHPEVSHVSPIFGNLNRAEWEQLHFKHSRHHLGQFGLS